MSLIPYQSLFELDGFFDGFFGPRALSNQNEGSAFRPRVDIRDKGDNYEIVADLPGVKKEDLHVTLEEVF